MFDCWFRKKNSSNTGENNQAFKGYGTNPGVWEATLPTDARAPCPALNSLANHGYLPRDGRKITKEMFDQALFAKGAFPFANDPNSPTGVRHESELLANGTPYLNLDDLNTHNRIEHDVSLTRQDAHFGDNHTIDPTLVKQFLGSSSDGAVISAKDLVKYRLSRYNDSKKRNPELTFGALQEGMAWGEASLVLTVFGNGNYVPVSHVESFFLHERIPDSYKKPNKLVDIVHSGVKITELIAHATAESLL
ncbi:UNVERIFIED_CONTAM: hypothetical protein HDU68_001779 [Siphonaria sp. JEL0065]|nr:hypothetical protein HDU68_001779 [Siphonaria sp. JEL0065]